jgi:hypothetical protein
MTISTPVSYTNRLRASKGLRIISKGAITLYKLGINFMVGIALSISWDMAPIQLHGWPVMNNPINTLH